MTKTKTTKSAHRSMDVLLFVFRNDGCNPKQVLASVYKDVASKNYGRQSPANFAIASLRKKGLLEDDCERCPHCQRAARGRRNVELRITEAGKKVAREFLATQRKAA